MADVKSIGTEEEYNRALARLWELFNSEPGTPDGDEFAVLADLLEVYEDKHYPIPLPTPAGAIEFWMDQSNLSADDLIPWIGSREMVDEVLAGQREVTPEMAEALYEKLNIDVRDLLGKTLSRADNP